MRSERRAARDDPVHSCLQCSRPSHELGRAGNLYFSTSRQRAKSTAATERIGHGGATHQTANLCSKLNCASLPRPQGRAGARLFQQPDLENHWVPLRNRALPSVMAFVAQATGFRNAEWGMRNAEEIRIELIPNSAFRIPHFFRCLGFSSSYELASRNQKRRFSRRRNLPYSKGRN